MKLLFALLPLLSLTTSARLPYSVGGSGSVGASGNVGANGYNSQSTPSNGYNSQSSPNYWGGYNGNAGQGYGSSGSSYPSSSWSSNSGSSYPSSSWSSNSGSSYPSSSWSSNNNQGSFSNSLLKNILNVNLMRQMLNNNNRNMNRMSSSNNMYNQNNVDSMSNMKRMYDNNNNMKSNTNSLSYGGSNMNQMNSMYNNNNMDRMSRMTNMDSTYNMDINNRLGSMSGMNNYNAADNMNRVSTRGGTPGGYNSVNLFDEDVKKAYGYVEHHTNSITQSKKLLKAISADRVSKQIVNGINYKFEGLRFYKTQCSGYGSYNGQDMGFSQWWMNKSDRQTCQEVFGNEVTNCDATVWWNPRGTPEYQVTQWKCR